MRNLLISSLIVFIPLLLVLLHELIKSIKNYLKFRQMVNLAEEVQSYMSLVRRLNLDNIKKISLSVVIVLLCNIIVLLTLLYV